MEEDKNQNTEKSGLSKEAVIEWIDKCKNDPNYEIQVGLALENEDPVAQEFLRKAKEIDPVFVKTSCFRNISPEE